MDELDLVTPYTDDEVVPYMGGHTLLASWTTHLSLLEGRMMRNEDAISKVVSAQNQQLRSLETVQQNVADLTNSIASLNHATLRDDIMNSVRDVVCQEAVLQVCDRCPGPSPTRAAVPVTAGPWRDVVASAAPPGVSLVASHRRAKKARSRSRHAGSSPP